MTKSAQRRRQENALYELRQERQCRRGPHDDSDAAMRRDPRGRENARPAERPETSALHGDENRRQTAAADSKKRDDDQQVSSTCRHSKRSVVRKESPNEHTQRAKGKSGTAGQAETKSGQTAVVVAQVTSTGKESTGTQTPEAGKPGVALQADPKVAPAEKPGSTAAGRQTPAKEPAEGNTRDQHAAKNRPVKSAAVSKKDVKGALPTKAQARGNKQVMPDDGGRVTVRMANGETSGIAKAGSSAAAKGAHNQPVPTAKAARQTASAVQVGAKTAAAAEAQQPEPGSQSGTQKQGGQTDLFGGGHSAPATVQGNAAADAGESVAQPFQQDLLQQIVDKAVLHLKGGKTELRIDLRPEALGHLRLHISTDQQQVTLKILTESTWVKAMVEHHISHLRAELQNHNLYIDHLDVSVAGDFQQTAGGNPQAGNPDRGVPRTEARPTAATVSEVALQPAQTQNTREQSGLIDYFV